MVTTLVINAARCRIINSRRDNHIHPMIKEDAAYPVPDAADTADKRPSSLTCVTDHCRKSRRIENETTVTERDEVFVKEGFHNMDLVSLDLAVRLGVTQFSYLPTLMKRLEHCRPTLLVNNGFFPLAPDLIDYKTKAIGINVHERYYGLGDLRGCNFQFDARYWSPKMELITGVITKDNDYLCAFDDDGDKLFVIDRHGVTMCISKTILREYERETYEDVPIFYCQTADAESIFLFSQNFVLVMKFIDLFKSLPFWYYVELSRGDGVPRDPKVEGVYVSCIRVEMVIVTDLLKCSPWHVGKDLLSHYRYNKLDNIITFIAVTEDSIELRDFRKDTMQWDDFTTTIQRKSDKSSFPIAFLFKDVFVIEETRGCFMAYDFTNRRCVHFESEFFSWVPYSLHWMFEGDNDALYLSLDNCSWYIP